MARSVDEIDEVALARLLRPRHQRELEAHAQSSYPQECCGALLGDDAGVLAVLPLENAAADPRSRFEVSPREYLRAEREAAALECRVLGVYHSHPDAPAVLSARDAAETDDSFLQVVVSVRQGAVAELRAFRAR